MNPTVSAYKMELLRNKLLCLRDYADKSDVTIPDEYVSPDYIKNKLFAGKRSIVLRLFLSCHPEKYDKEKLKKFGMLGVERGVAPYGLVIHAGVQINKLTVNLYAPGLVAIDGFKSSSCFFLFSPEHDKTEIAYSPDLADKITNLIVRWNCEVEYDEKTANCQHFANELIRTCVPNYKPTGLIGNYVQELVRGEAISKDHTTGTLVYHIKLSDSRELTFRNHQELDEEQEKLNISDGDYTFLKAFHRGFQARNPDERCEAGYGSLTVGGPQEQSTLQ